MMDYPLKENFSNGNCQMMPANGQHLIYKPLADLQNQ
jgi:hypothetical protein